MTSSDRGKNQSAYRILVALEKENLDFDIGDMWDSGKVQDDQSTNIVYKGKPLESGKRYYWKVKIWDEIGIPSDFSQVTWFEMGKLHPGDWHASWISQQKDSTGMPLLLSAPYFRKDFFINKEVLYARLYITGLGYYKAFINGQKVGDHELDPVFTRYDRRVKYVVFDITDLLKQGANCVGVVLGNGWYNQHTRSAWDLDSATWREDPSLLAQVEVFYTNGSKVTISTDNSWEVSNGPIIFDGIRNGEHYDARREIAGWNDIGNDDGEWVNAYEVKGPQGILSSQVMPPIREIRSLKPIRINEPRPGIYLLDFGVNITGRLKISVMGKPDQLITIKYGERVKSDGTLDQKELARFIWTGDTQTDRYICKGDGIESWESGFVYHGFQYVEVHGLTEAPSENQITAKVLHTDLESAGVFLCSNKMFNKLHQNILNSFLGNYHGYPTDCPHREKIGWSGDAQLVSATGLYNFHMIPAYLKWIDDFTDEQRPDGKVPAIIPTSGWGYIHGKGQGREHGYGPHWEGAFLNIPWDMYMFTGDLNIIRRYYDGFKAYLTYLERSAEDYILDYGIDDHKPVTTITDGDILSTGYFYDFAKKMSLLASRLNKENDMKYYNILADKIYMAFNERFFNKEENIYGNGGQTSISEALYLGLVPDDVKDQVISNLLQEIQDKKYHIDAGVVGTRFMIKALTDLGLSDVMYRIANQPNFPGWGYWIEGGATSMWQTWKGDMSLNHIMFGSIGEWFYNTLAGIRIDPENPGFRRFILKPEVTDSLEWVDCSYESLYGQIDSKWERRDKQFSWHIEIPVNTTALVYLPVKYGTEIRESGKKVKNNPFMKIIEKKGHHWLIEISSGKYDFLVK